MRLAGKKWTICGWCQFAIGCGLTTLSIILLAYLPTIFEAQIRKKIVLQPGGEIYEKWLNPPVNIYFRVWLFHVENTEEFLTGQEKPRLREVGPFTFNQKRIKDVTRWSEDGTKLWFRERKGYWFNRELSVSDIFTTNITIVNVPLAGISARAERAQNIPVVGWFLNGLMDSAFRAFGEDTFTTRMVHEVLFDGYKIDILRPMNIFGREVVPGNSFGLFYKRNLTWTPQKDGEWGIYTGLGGTSKNYTYANEWNGSDKLKFWGSKYCNMVNGSNGAQFPPFVKKTDTLYSFTTDICRSIPLEFVRDTEVHGIPLYRFGVPQKTFASPYINPDNMCYCPKTTEADRRRYCDFSGVLDISVCQKGAPILVSAPHFMYADRVIQEAVEGLKPNPKKHETFVDIEPMTGTVMRASRRLQLNVRITPATESDPQEGMLSGLSDIVFPIGWIEESAEIDENLAEQFKAKVFAKLFLMKMILLAMLVIGLLMILIPTAIYLVRKFSSMWKTNSRVSRNSIERQNASNTATSSKPHKSILKIPSWSDPSPKKTATISLPQHPAQRQAEALPLKNQHLPVQHQSSTISSMTNQSDYPPSYNSAFEQDVKHDVGVQSDEEEADRSMIVHHRAVIEPSHATNELEKPPLS